MSLFLLRPFSCFRDMQRSVEYASKRASPWSSGGLGAVSDELLRLRAAGRTAHAIFADAILHLLLDGPITTVELNQAIQRIHPDLCDDSIDRVINIAAFWQEMEACSVRMTQVFLRRRGDIRLEDRKWRLAK